MSDPIADIIERVIFDADDPEQQVFIAAKQIRQQIGRELLHSEHMGQYANKVVTDTICEVCQLDEKHD